MAKFKKRGFRRHRRRAQFKKRRGFKGKTKPFKVPKISTMKSRKMICDDRAFVKLRYMNANIGSVLFQDVYLNFGGLTNFQTKTFLLNGVWDPDPVIASVATLGLTSWSSFYNYYRAHSVKIKCTMNNPLSVPMYMGICALAPNASVPASWSACKTSRGNAWNKQVLLEPTGSRCIHTFNMYVQLADLFGSPAQYLTDPTLFGSTNGDVAGANPSTKLTLVLYAATADGSNVTTTVVYDIELTYYVELFGRRELLIS